MKPSQKKILMIGSSSKKSKFPGVRPSISTDNRGDPLTGVKYDIAGIKAKYKNQQPQFIQTSQDQNLLLTKNYILNWLQIKFQESSYQVYLFYTGHGHQNGDWAVETVEKPEGDRISLEQIIKIWKQHRPTKKSHLVIYMDSCHSGWWCYRLGDIQQTGLNISIYASCERKEVAKDCLGGLLLKCIYGSIQQFDDNCELLQQKQRPIYLHYKAERVAELQKDRIKFLNKNIANALKTAQQIDAQQSKIRSQPIKQIEIKVVSKKFSDGQYVGQFLNNKRHGNGFMKYADGSKFNGQWKNDKIEGKGILQKANGDVYEGDFIDGKAHGRGVCAFANGDKYEGQWKNDKKNGRGTCAYANEEQYIGQFKNDLKNGFGTYYFADKGQYKGEWKDNKPHGKGIQKFANGEIYQGQFKNGVPEGKGIYYYTDKSRYDGEYYDQKKNGYGIYYYANGTKFQGYFKDDRKDGVGIFYYANGRKQQQTYKQGKFISDRLLQ